MGLAILVISFLLLASPTAWAEDAGCGKTQSAADFLGKGLESLERDPCLQRWGSSGHVNYEPVHAGTSQQEIFHYEEVETGGAMYVLLVKKVYRFGHLVSDNVVDVLAYPNYDTWNPTRIALTVLNYCRQKARPFYAPDMQATFCEAHIDTENQIRPLRLWRIDLEKEKFVEGDASQLICSMEEWQKWESSHMPESEKKWINESLRKRTLPLKPWQVVAEY